MKMVRLILAVLILPVMVFASIGKISALNGDVSIIRASKTLKASAGSDLEQKDIVKASKGSAAQIVFNDKTVITVGSATTFKIEEYLFDEKTPNAKFKVEEGSFKAITGKIGKIAPDKFKLETKTATIGIRGTAFVGKTDANGNLIVACTKGAIVVTPIGVFQAPPPPVIVPAGQMTNANQSGVEPPRPFTPNDLKNLSGDMNGYARRDGDNNQNNAQNHDDKDKDKDKDKGSALVNNDVKDNISDTTTEISNSKLNDDVASKTQTITAEYIDSLANTKYANLPTSGTYTYKSIKAGDNGAGFIDMSTKIAYYSSFDVSNNKFESEFGFAQVSSDDGGNARVNFGYTGLGYNNTSMGGYGFYSGSVDGYLKGPDALYGKLVDTGSNFTDNTTYISGQQYSNQAAAYSNGGYTATSYNVAGSSIGFQAGTGDYTVYGLSAPISVDHTIGTIDITWNNSTLSLTSLSLPISGNTTDSRYVSEDAFAMSTISSNSTSGGQLVTVYDGKTDYASWGYWFDANVDLTRFGFWVGGALTAVGDMPTTGSATYSGKVLGGVASASNGFDLINSDSSSVNLNVNFGATSSVNGNMAFTTKGGQAWNLTVSNGAVSGSGLSGNINSGSLNGSVAEISNGTYAGNFYGPNAATVGGTFSATANATYTAAGVFKANKQ